MIFFQVIVCRNNEIGIFSRHVLVQSMIGTAAVIMFLQNSACCLQAFDTAQKELGIAPVMTGEDLVSCAVPDKLTMVAYLSQFYELFKHEPLPSSEYTSKI